MFRFLMSRISLLSRFRLLEGLKFRGIFYHLRNSSMVPSVLEFRTSSIDFNVCRCNLTSFFLLSNYLRHEVSPYNAFLRTVKSCEIKNRFQLTFGMSMKSWFEWIFDYKSVRCDLTEFSEFRHSRERLKKVEVPTFEVALKF